METTSNKPDKLSRAQKIKAAAVAVVAFSGISYAAIPPVHSAIDTAVANAEGTPQTANILDEPHKVVDATQNNHTVYDIAVEAAGKDGNILAIQDEITKALGGNTNLVDGESVPVPEDSVVGKQVGPQNG